MTEIDKDKIKATLDLILKDFKTLETELVAHQEIIKGFKTQFSDLDDCLELMRKNPAILQAMNRKYDEIRNTWHKDLDLMKSVDEFFQAWKPLGPIN